MTPADLIAARKALGLTQDGLADRLGLRGKNRDRTIRRYEQDGAKVPQIIELKLEKLMPPRTRP